MKLISLLEAASRNRAELNALHREAFNAFASATPRSEDCGSALASLENIEAELALRQHSLR